MEAVRPSDIFSVHYEMVERDKVFEIKALGIYRNEHKDSPDARLEHGIE
jgi:hypothetical protein